MPIQVTDDIRIEDSELEEQFIRASGPGGQNVNKVSTAVQLRFQVAGSPSLPAPVRARLEHLARNRINSDGELVIEARRFRSQERNREDARDRLAELVRRALEPPKPRRKTRPTLASKRRRLEGKRRRSDLKRLRGTTED